MKTLLAIKVHAASIFGNIPDLANLAGTHVSLEQIRGWFSNGRVFTVDDSGRPVGFVAAIPIDTTLHMAEERPSKPR